MATIKEWNFGELIRECYLRSTPSVDLNDVSKESPIKCSSYKLSCSEYDTILREYGVIDDEGNTLHEVRHEACTTFMLMSGPQLYEDAA